MFHDPSRHFAGSKMLVWGEGIDVFDTLLLGSPGLTIFFGGTNQT